MGITSIAFIGFTSLIFIIYHLIPKRFKKYWLLLSSLIFYSTWDWKFVLIIITLILINYYLGKRLGESKKTNIYWLWLGIVLNVIGLLFFKYANFFAAPLTSLLINLGIRINQGTLEIMLPVGLSFFILQAISYLVDVNRKRMSTEHDLVNLGLYFVYFPKLISGPIERAKTFIPKLTNPQVVDNDLLRRSFGLIIIGIARKVIFADTLASLIPENVFINPWDYAGQFLIVWLIAYSFSLYNDFAGYTSIMRGISGLFGIELSANFSRPYFSKNFTEFWKRWHISFSEWLRDYIFFPVTRSLLRIIPNRRNALNLILPPTITMLISGLWHGVSWHMLLWGGLHAGAQVIERMISIWRPAVPAEKLKRWKQSLAGLFVFGFVTTAWIPFRMDLLQAKNFIKGIMGISFWVFPEIGPFKTNLLNGTSLWEWKHWLFPDLRLLIILIPAYWLDWIQERSQDELVFLNWTKWRQAFILAIFILAILLVSGANNLAPFVYQGF